jgi:glycosyltransferase involved in cell wall biosynthesis
VSVVVPVYNNAATLSALHERLHRVLERANLRYEIIFVDDACPFGSLAELDRIAALHANVRVTALPINVGQHRAALIGLAQVRGRSAVIMDADLQDPPEGIPMLLEKLDGHAAVFAGRRGRYESPGRLATSWLFKTLLHVLSGVPRDAGMYVALNREMIEHLLARREKHPFVVAMIGTSGFRVASVPIHRSTRTSGRSSYTGRLRFKSAVAALRIALRGAVRVNAR